MDYRDKLLTMSSVLQGLLAIAPVQLSNVLVFLISPKRDDARFSRLERFLDQDDKLRLRTFTAPDLGHRFVTGRAALRCILTTIEDRDVPEAAWRFGSLANGKPHIRAPKTSIASFNLSYGDSFIAIAVSNSVDVGIDIEVEHAIPDDEIPWHLFSGDEQQLLRATPELVFSNAFFRLWTLKEAIAKQTGQGFATEFSEINTLDLGVAEGVKALDPSAESFLFHTRLIIEDKPLHLAISTSPAH